MKCEKTIFGWAINLGPAEVTIPYYENGQLEGAEFRDMIAYKRLDGREFVAKGSLVMVKGEIEYSYRLYSELDHNHKRGRHSTSNNKRRYRQLKIVPIEEDDLPF